MHKNLLHLQKKKNKELVLFSKYGKMSEHIVHLQIKNNIFTLSLLVKLLKFVFLLKKY